MNEEQARSLYVHIALRAALELGRVTFNLRVRWLRAQERLCFRPVREGESARRYLAQLAARIATADDASRRAHERAAILQGERDGIPDPRMVRAALLVGERVTDRPSRRRRNGPSIVAAIVADLPNLARRYHAQRASGRGVLEEPTAGALADLEARQRATARAVPAVQATSAPSIAQEATPAPSSVTEATPAPEDNGDGAIALALEGGDRRAIAFRLGVNLPRHLTPIEPATCTRCGCSFAGGEILPHACLEAPARPADSADPGGLLKARGIVAGRRIRSGIDPERVRARMEERRRRWATTCRVCSSPPGEPCDGDAGECAGEGERASVTDARASAARNALPSADALAASFGRTCAHGTPWATACDGCAEEARAAGEAAGVLPPDPRQSKVIGSQEHAIGTHDPARCLPCGGAALSPAALEGIPAAGGAWWCNCGALVRVRRCPSCERVAPRGWKP